MKQGINTLSHNFYISTKKYLDKYLATVTNDLLDSAKTELSGWRHDVMDALGYKIPSWESQSGKTKDRSRLFPYKRRGNLQQTPRTTVKSFHIHDKVRIFMSGNITSPVADYTTSIGDGAWVGWKDDVLFGGGRDSVPSLRDVFSSLITYRRSKI